MSKFTAVGFLSPKQSRPRNWLTLSQVARVSRGSCGLCPGPGGSCSGDGQQGGQLSSLLFLTSSHTYHPCPWPIAHALQKSGSSPSLGTKSHDLKMCVDNTSCQCQRFSLEGLGGAFRSAGQRGGQAGDCRRAGGRLGRSGGLSIGFSAIEHAVSGLAVPRWWRCPTPKLSSCQSTSRTGAREWCRGTPSVFLSCPIPFSMSARRHVQMCVSLQKWSSLDIAQVVMVSATADAASSNILLLKHMERHFLSMAAPSGSCKSQLRKFARPR